MNFLMFNHEFSSGLIKWTVATEGSKNYRSGPSFRTLNEVTVLNHSSPPPPVSIRLYSNIKSVCTDCKGVQELKVLEQRISTNVYMQIYPYFETSAAFLKNNQFSLKTIGQNGSLLDEGLSKYLDNSLLLKMLLH